jgi:hypothetical protein
VVKQTKPAPLVTVPVELIVSAEPAISTRSDPFPPVQVKGRPELRTTVVGSPPVMFKGVGKLTDTVNALTSLPPAPLMV